MVPVDVDAEITRGRETHAGIPRVADVEWAELAVLTDDEQWTQLIVKADMGGAPYEHLGECAVIACAKHRGLVAVLDDRAAVAQAIHHDVPTISTLWIVVEAYKSLFGRDRQRAAGVVDDLLSTGMYLPFTSGASLFSWAYEEGLLP